jgi:hypothetical protein
MKQRNVVILKIGDGNLDTTGFAFNLQVWRQGQERLNCDGRLPAALAVRDRFEDWTETANNLGHAYLISLPTVQVTNVDIVDNCRTAAIAFEAVFNQWLMQGVVVNSLIVPLVQAMPQAQGLKFFIQTSDPLLQRLPWQVWQFLSQTYPQVARADLSDRGGYFGHDGDAGFDTDRIDSGHDDHVAKTTHPNGITRSSVA